MRGGERGDKLAVWRRESRAAVAVQASGAWGGAGGR